MWNEGTRAGGKAVRSEFIAAGAEAYRQHLDSPEVHLFETGHFVLEEDAPRILPLIRSFLRQVD